MPDPRHQKLARVLINYSLKIQPGDKLQIRTQPQAVDLIREVYREALLAGGHPVVRTMLGPWPSGTIALDGLTDVLLKEGSDDQLKYFSELDAQEMEHFDAMLVIMAQDNTRGLSGVDPARLALLQQSHAPLMTRYMERSAAGELRWCATVFPTQAHAQDAGMSLREYEDFVYGAGLLDGGDPVEAWRRVHAEQQRIADYLARHDQIHIVAPDTDITYRVGGRTWLNASGSHNFPDGEVFTGPHEDSVNGTVRFSYPVVYSGREVEDVRLTFKEGKVVDARAARGQDLMLSLIDQDPGARYVGEVAFGLNYGIQRFSRLILFDEKIGGTMHMALGRSYAETGGKNQSALHWDMICDLREGEVYADGELCYKAGRFTI